MKISTLLFATALYAVFGYAGFVLFGPIPGVALWRVFFVAGLSGFVFGSLYSMEKTE